MLLIFVSSTTFAYQEKIEKWNKNSLISEELAIDYIYEFAYDRFIGDDGESCEPQMDYAELVKLKNEKSFIIDVELYVANIGYWACSYLDSEQGLFRLKFSYNDKYKRFKVSELPITEEL
tara:strand:- start:70507 stop:70866 length:360 start_codon:yes stop_codon:yes gene_type:complete